MISALLPLIGLQVAVTGPAPPLKKAIPATTWSCEFLGENETRFSLSGTFEEVPKGWNPNGSRPTIVKGNGPSFLLGNMRFTAGSGDTDYRRYQIRMPYDAERKLFHYIGLDLNRFGYGLADISRYGRVNDDLITDYLAAGLCKANFDPREDSQ